MLLLLLLTSCASTVVRSGRPPGPVASDFDERWHAAFLFGAIPARHSFDLRAACPEGWSEVRLEPDEFTVVASLLTAFLYSPTRLTVVCAADPEKGPPRLGIYPPPGREDDAPTRAE